MSEQQAAEQSEQRACNRGMGMMLLLAGQGAFWLVVGWLLRGWLL